MPGIVDGSPKATDEAREEVAQNRSTISRYVQKGKSAWNAMCPFQSLRFSEHP